MCFLAWFLPISPRDYKLHENKDFISCLSGYPQCLESFLKHSKFLISSICKRFHVFPSISMLTGLTESELGRKLRRWLQYGVTSVTRSGGAAEHGRGALICQLKVKLLYNPYVTGRETREFTLFAYLQQRLSWKTHNLKLKRCWNRVIFALLSPANVHLIQRKKCHPRFCHYTYLSLVPLKLGCGDTSWRWVSMSLMTCTESSQPWWH